MEDFTNQVLLPNDIPTIASEDFTLLDKKWLYISYFKIAIFFLIGSIIILVLYLMVDDIPNVVLLSGGLFVCIVTIYSVLITILGFPKKGFLVRDKDISYKQGLIVYKQVTIPFNRIQHVEVNQGILSKLFGLSTIKLFTAGGNASDLSIPGLPRDYANNLKTFLSEKISTHE